jgi:hypothetical protein
MRPMLMRLSAITPNPTQRFIPASPLYRLLDVKFKPGLDVVDSMFFEFADIGRRPRCIPEGGQ